MRCRYLVPALGLLASVGTANAAELGGGLSIGGFVDTIFSYVDEDASEDPTVDFWAGAVIQTMASIGDDVSLQVDLQYDGDSSDLALRQAYATWSMTDEFSLQMGKSISWIGWQAAYAPGLYRINVTPYTGQFYGNDTTGVWGIITPTENVSITLAVVDDIYGTKTESDSLAFGGEVSVDLEGYGNVQLELQFDPSGADYFSTAVAPDDAAFGVVAHTTADQVVENLLLGAEIAYTDFDVANTMGLMAMGNYTLGTEIPMSVTAMVSYFEPDDEVDDDEEVEFALALLTNPTNDANFAVNAELSYISASADDSDSFGIFLEALAIIP
ncbi:MAG: hypothetical protein PF961_19340 [Planctomycetota bacterium]|nr:hypothetical protein [Planctomycetota bacterium]